MHPAELAELKSGAITGASHAMRRRVRRGPPGGSGVHRNAFQLERFTPRATVPNAGRIGASPDEACRFETGPANSAAMIGRAIMPTTIGTLPLRSAMSLLSLFFVPGAAQAILLAVVPLEALHLLGAARAVTLLYVVAGLIAAVVGRFSIPFLAGSIGRRSVFTLGTLSLAASSILFALNNVRRVAWCSARLPSRASRSPVSFTCLIWFRVIRSDTSNRSESSPSPDPGPSGRGWALCWSSPSSTQWAVS